MCCFFSQEEDDTNYVEENEAADVFDSDFDEDVCVSLFIAILIFFCETFSYFAKNVSFMKID